MTEIEFIQSLKEALYQLFSDGEKYYFAVFQVPENNDKFFQYSQNYLLSKINFKGEDWFEIDKYNFAINFKLPENIKAYFINNEIPAYIKDLNPENFEKITAILFSKFFNNLLVEENRQGCDDGIDFYGKYNSYGKENEFTNFFHKNTWYIGQVKKYSYNNTISTKYIRELLGTIELAKHNIWSLKNSYSNMDIKKNEAIIPIFVTSSRYSSIVIDISNRLGIKLLDDIDVMFWLTILYKGN